MIPLEGDVPQPRWLRVTITVLVVLLSASLAVGYATAGLRRPACADVDGQQVTARWSWSDAQWVCPLPAGSGVPA